MRKIGLVIVALFVISGCSDKKEELNPKKIDTVETNLTKSIENNDTNDTKESNKTVQKKSMMLIKEEFIPEHIRNSHIEVVEHY